MNLGVECADPSARGRFQNGKGGGEGRAAIVHRKQVFWHAGTMHGDNPAAVRAEGMHHAARQFVGPETLVSHPVETKPLPAAEILVAFP